MENFEQKLVNDIQNNILKGIKDCNFVNSFHSSKISIPHDVVMAAYSFIDKDVILEKVKSAIEEQIAQTIINSLMTETATDTKRIMQDQALRQQIKNKVYPQILSIVNEN